MINGVEIISLNVIPKNNGRIIHHTKKTDNNFSEFGELYISTFDQSTPKFWKKHSQMTCALMVISGVVKFNFCNINNDIKFEESFSTITLSFDDFKKIVIAPGIWFTFQSVEPFNESAILNLADMEHKKNEGAKIPFEHLIIGKV